MLSIKQLKYCVVILVFIYLSLATQIVGTTKAGTSISACNSTALNISEISQNQTNRNTSCNNTTTKILSNSPTQISRELYIRRIASSVVAGIGALFNAVLFVAILVDPLKILRKGSWITIINLAAADFIACTSNFFLVTRNMFGIETLELVLACYFGWGLGVSASFMLLGFFTMQVYMITKFPFKAPRMLTRTKVAMACVGIWLLATPLGYFQIAWWKFEYTKALKMLIAKIVVLEIVVVIQIILKIQICFEILKSRRSVGQPESGKHRHIATTVMILLVVQLLTAVPFFVAKQVEYFTNLDMLPRYPLLEKFSYYYAPIAILNFCANPVLYSLRLPDYRRTLLSIFGRKRSIQRSTVRSFTMKSERTPSKQEATSETTTID